MSHGFFEAMDETRNARRAGFVKSLKKYNLPDPVNYAFHFSRESGNEQTEWRNFDVPKETSATAAYLAFRAKTKSGERLFDDDQVLPAASRLMELDSWYLEKLVERVMKDLDNVDEKLFEDIVGNSKAMDTPSTSAT